MNDIPVCTIRKGSALTCASAFLVTGLMLSATPTSAQTKPVKQAAGKQMTDPAKVHAEAVVIDTHADTPQRFVDENWNFTDPLNGGMLNYDSAKKGNLDAQFFSIWVDPGQYPAKESANRTLALIDG